MKPVSPNFTTQRLLTTAAILIVVTFLVYGIKAFSNDPKLVEQTAPISTTTQPSVPPATKADDHGGHGENEDEHDHADHADAYTDGTYTATGTYESPGGTQTIDVSLTLAGNKVADATVTPKATDGVAQLYQSDFVQGYKKLVVGKSLEDIHVKRVSGSSLTSIGFTEALKQIKSEAKT